MRRIIEGALIQRRHIADKDTHTQVIISFWINEVLLIVEHVEDNTVENTKKQE